MKDISKRLKDKTRPCPRCGSRDLTYWRNRADKYPWWHISCDECYWFGPRKLFLRRAIAAWNNLTKY